MPKKFHELRKKYPVFTFEKYTVNFLKDKIKIKFFFTIDKLASFSPLWTFTKSKKFNIKTNKELINKLAFNLGMIELISCWKTACPPRVIVKAGALDDFQKKWWKTQYFLGMAEFFYTNKIKTDYKSFMSIDAPSPHADFKKTRISAKKNGCLIPIGGGKDSAVTLELLKKHKDKLCCAINPREAQLQCAFAAGFKKEKIIKAERSLDKKMLELNKKGYLNGHTPFSAVVAFSSVLSAALHNKKYVVLSNESSASESTVKGAKINHQYSKSFKFESDFKKYEKKYINSGADYFSILRPFNELQIARYFSKHKKYFGVFKSCNAGSKNNSWCGVCSKCLFTYIVLSPFIPQETLKGLFGANLPENKNLLNMFNKLTGALPEKPFECVGSYDDVNIALCMAVKKLDEKKEELPALFEYYKTTSLYKKYKNKKNYLKQLNKKNFVPEKFSGAVKKLIEVKN